MDPTIDTLCGLIIVLLCILSVFLLIHLLRCHHVSMDLTQSVVVSSFVEALSEVCPIGVDKTWELSPSPGNHPRCWKLLQPLLIVGKESKVYGSCVVVQSPSLDVINLISDTSHWSKWKLLLADDTEFCIMENEDVSLQQDMFMQSHTVSRKANTQNTANFVMYRFMSHKNSKTQWVLFWNVYSYDWYFFLVQRLRYDADSCSLTLMRGAHFFPKSEDPVEFLCSRIMRIKDAVEMGNLKVLPCQPVFGDSTSLDEERPCSPKESAKLQAKEKHKTERKKNALKATETELNQTVPRNFLLHLIPVSLRIPATYRNLKGFSLASCETNTDMDLKGKEDLPPSVQINPNTASTKENISPLDPSKSSSSEVCLPLQSSSRGMVGSDRPKSTNEIVLSNSQRTTKKCNVSNKTKDEASPNKGKEQEKEEQNKNLAFGRDKSPSCSDFRTPGIFRSEINLANIKKHLSKRRTKTVAGPSTELPGNVKPLNTTTEKEGKKKKKSLATDERNSETDQRGCDDVDCVLSKRRKQTEADGNKNHGKSSSGSSMVSENGNFSEDSSSGERFEILLPPIPISGQRIADMITKGNYCASELQAEVLEVSRISHLTESNKALSDNWTMVSTTKGVTVFMKRRFFGSLKTASCMSQMKVLVKPDEIWKILRNPLSRFIYDNSIKKVTVLEEFADNQKLLYTQHELGGLLKKEAIDFCLLHTERSENGKFTLAFNSIEYENCPLSFSTRGQYLPSGWVIEEGGSGEMSIVSFLVQVMTNGSDSLLENELTNIQSHSILNLHSYLTSTPCPRKQKSKKLFSSHS